MPSTLLLLLAGVAATPLHEEPFHLAEASEVVAVVSTSCESCSWGERGREATVLALELDGRYSQHLALTRGARAADYSVALGPVGAGAHRLRLMLDPKASAREAGRVRVD